MWVCECLERGGWSGATPFVSAILPVQSESARVPLFAPALLSGSTTVRTGEGHVQWTSHSMANNLKLPLAKSGRKGILQIQKVNSTYSFPNLVNNVYAFTTTECMHSTVLLLSYLLSNSYILAIQFFISKIGVLYLDSHSISNLKSKSYHYFFYPSTVAYPQRALLYPDWASSSSCLGLPFGSTRYPWYPHSSANLI